MLKPKIFYSINNRKQINNIDLNIYDQSKHRVVNLTVNVMLLK